MYMIGYEIKGVEHYWNSCGWSEHRSCASKYAKGEASNIIKQMHFDDVYAYLV